MTLLTERDTILEDEARFYIAEMITAIDIIHMYGLMHHGIKPDNLTSTKTGI